MSPFNHKRRGFRRWSCRQTTALVRAAATALLLMRLTASLAHAQSSSATAPARGAGSHSWVHESWTIKDGLPVNSINSIL